MMNIDMDVSIKSYCLEKINIFQYEEFISTMNRKFTVKKIITKIKLETNTYCTVRTSRF